ncbi:MAG: hypothetical protein JO307_18940, partial [Bryobacterales bacterium]|nr:hypothetical protein [Bryobacterales bacterium]
MKRTAYYLCAPVVCLALFWKGLFTWFRLDDFAFLGLASTVHDFPSLGHALFHPVAQGTVRVISDRLFFLSLYTMFGVRAGPFHVVIWVLWFIALALITEIGTRITGSRAAGLLAALLCTVSKVMVAPLAWVAISEVIFCAVFALAALYSRIRWLESGRRGWQAAEWIFYILGFGAQESMVMYPAVAVVYTMAVTRKNVLAKGRRGVFALFIPAAIFTAIHAFLIPRLPSEIYRVAIDTRLPDTLSMYLRMAVGPEHYASRKILLPVLASFVIWRLWRRDWAALFCGAWFLLWLAPVLPLPNHISEYYLATPLIGLAWLGGWGLVVAWRAGWTARTAAAVLVTLYLANAVPAIGEETAWYLNGSSRMRVLFRGMQEAARRYPGTAVIFKGVDNDLFQTGFQDNPYRLAGVSKAFLAPGSENGIVAREDLGGVKRFTISTEDALRLIESAQARVLEITAGPPHDVTESFETVMRAEFLAKHREFVDVGQPLYVSRVGPSWHKIENGYRWMPKSATVQLAGPSSASERLYVSGYAPANVVASGPLTLRFHAAGQDIGSFAVSRPDR